MSEKYTVIWECVLLRIYVYSWVRVHMRVIRAEGSNWSSYWAIGSVCVCVCVCVRVLCWHWCESCCSHVCVCEWVSTCICMCACVSAYVCVHTVSMCTRSYVLHICLWMCSCDRCMYCMYMLLCVHSIYICIYVCAWANKQWAKLAMYICTYSSCS